MAKRRYRARQRNGNGNGNGRMFRITLQPGDRLIVRVRSNE